MLGKFKELKCALSQCEQITSTDGGNMILVKHSYDFEMYSSTSKGAIQGYGFEFHKGK